MLPLNGWLKKRRAKQAETHLTMPVKIILNVITQKMAKDIAAYAIKDLKETPYLGCTDINECKELSKYKCDGTCKNTIGNYTCHCPLGMYGDGKVSCRRFRITTIFAVIGAVSFVVIVGVFIFIICKERRKQGNFLKNGGTILKHQRVRIFRAAELAKATKNYVNSQFLGEGGFGFVYKGVLPDNTLVAVKKPKESDKNIQINSIAAQIADALGYFHSLASPPIIHGDVKSTNILLGDNYIAKVADFGASVLISPDQTAMVTKVQGTFGYLDPEYLMTGILTEKSDVYSYGVVLIELLTGVKPGSCLKSNDEKINLVQYFLSSIENNCLFQILSFTVADESEMEEIEIVAELAKKCVSSSGIQRPTMKEVADELNRLRKLRDSLWARENSEETEHLLGESSSNSTFEHSTAVISQQHNETVISFDIENYSYSM
ncbi:putative Kinase [Melia azedarach]|uniref:Kinase n=1 Tax=Melia azedarach TaxID=155640 RepID=A0ACC1YMQ0_MELAZ|nr:putative Kinase [Melia azedarach]